MKNERWFPILQAIVIVLFLVLLIWAIVRNVNQEPQFTIYEEVCRNEVYANDTLEREFEELRELSRELTISYGEKDCDVIQRYNLFDEVPICKKLSEEIKDISTQKNKKLSDWAGPEYDIIKEVCEQVEVGRIEIERGRWDDNDENRFLYEHDCNTLFKESTITTCEDDYNFDCCYEFLFEQDLTIEWLDENCERIQGECLKWGKRGSDGISICKNEIKKYSCGKYIVEVTK